MSCSRVTAAGHGWEHWQAFSLVRHGHDGGGAEGGDCEDDGRTHGGFVVVVVGFGLNRGKVAEIDLDVLIFELMIVDVEDILVKGLYLSLHQTCKSQVSIATIYGPDVYNRMVSLASMYSKREKQPQRMEICRY